MSGGGSTPRHSKRRSSKRRSSTASATSRQGTPRRSMSGGRSTSSSSRSGLRPPSGTGVSLSGLASYPASPRATGAGGGTTSRSRSGNPLVPSTTASGASPAFPQGGSLSGARGSSGCGAAPPVRRSISSSHEGDGVAAASGSGSAGARVGQVADLNGPSHAGRPPVPKPSPRDVSATPSDAPTGASHETYTATAALCRQISSASSNGSSQAAGPAGCVAQGEDPYASLTGGWAPAGTALAALSASVSKPSTPLLPSLHVRMSGRLLDLPATPQSHPQPQPQPHLLGASAVGRPANQGLGALALQPDSPLAAVPTRLTALQSTSPAACGSLPHSPAAATAGVALHPHPRRPSLEPLSPSAVLAGLAHAAGGSEPQQYIHWSEAEGVANASSGHQATHAAAPFSPPLGPRPPSHLMPLGHPPVLLQHHAPTPYQTAQPVAAVGPASRVVSHLKTAADQVTAPLSLNLRGTAPAGLFVAGSGGGSSQHAPAAGAEPGDALFVVNGSAACKPKSAASGAANSRRSSRQASPARASLFHIQQLNGSGSRAAAVAAGSADPEEQVRKAQERLEAYSRAQKEKARVAEAEEAARRQRHVSAWGVRLAVHR